MKLGKILSDHRYNRIPSKQPVKRRPVVAAPRDRSGSHSALGRGDGTGASGDLKRVASDEPPGRVSLVKFLAYDAATVWACVGFHVLIEYAADD